MKAMPTLPVSFYVLLVFCNFAALTPAGARIYRWTDEHGQVHFGDQRPTGEAAGRVESFRGTATVSFIGGAGDAATASAAKVRMFVTQRCGYCKQAKAFLAQRGTPFEELDVEASPRAKAEFDKLGGKGVPVILVGRQRMDGFDAGQMERLLSASGL